MLALQLGACGVESLDIDGKDRASVYLNCPKLDSPLFEGWEWVGQMWKFDLEECWRLGVSCLGWPRQCFSNLNRHMPPLSILLTCRFCFGRSVVGTETLHFLQAPSCCQCCWNMGLSLSTRVQSNDSQTWLLIGISWRDFFKSGSRPQLRPVRSESQHGTRDQYFCKASLVVAMCSQV